MLDTLYEDDDHEYVVWKWRPVGAAPVGPPALRVLRGQAGA